MPVMPVLNLGTALPRPALTKDIEVGFSDVLLAQLMPLSETPLLTPVITSVTEPLNEDGVPEQPLLGLPTVMDTHLLQQLVSQWPVGNQTASDGLSLIVDHEDSHAVSLRNTRVPDPLFAVESARSSHSEQTEATNVSRPVAPLLMTGADTEMPLPRRDVVVNAEPDHLAMPSSVLATMPAASVISEVNATSSQRVMVSAPVGSEPWQQAIGEQLKVMVHQGVHKAELKLHPEDMGTLQISLRMQQDQAQVTVLSDHPQVRTALEAALPQLRAALAENGIQLGESSVGAGHSNTQDDTPHFAERAVSSADVVDEQEEKSVITVSNGAINTFV